MIARALATGKELWKKAAGHIFCLEPIVISNPAGEYVLFQRSSIAALAAGLVVLSGENGEDVRLFDNYNHTWNQILVSQAQIG